MKEAKAYFGKNKHGFVAKLFFILNRKLDEITVFDTVLVFACKFI